MARSSWGGGDLFVLDRDEEDQITDLVDEWIKTWKENLVYLSRAEYEDAGGNKSVVSVEWTD